MTTGSRLTARPLGPDETAFAAHAVRAVQPRHPWSEEELRLHWEMSDRMGQRRTLVLEEAGRPAGWVEATMWDEAPEKASRVLVHVPAAGPDQLDQAWAIVEETAGDLGARLGRATVWEDDAATLEALRRRDWEEKRRERYWRLELAGQGDRLRALRDAARRRVDAAGVRIATADELGGEAVYPALYQLEDVTAGDIPRDIARVSIPYEAWLVWMRPPAIAPERVWVALVGDRLVGVSYLDYGATPVSTAYTGVLREHRGAGIARALKLEKMVQAIELGVEAVETDNDEANAPILHLNEELGYGEIPGLVKLHKPLGAGGGGAS
jgi:GNAT superfamily N-acetyltransferase